MLLESAGATRIRTLPTRLVSPIAVVYKYGGEYMDLDIVSIAPLPCHELAVSMETDRRYNNCFLSFPPGNPCLWQIMKDFIEHFNNAVWGHQGPTLITRMLEGGGRGACRNQTIHVHRSNVLAPIGWQTLSTERKHYKRENASHPGNNGSIERLGAGDIARLRGSGSVAVHVYNKITRGRTSSALCPP